MIAHRPRRTSSPRHTALGFALVGVLSLCGAGVSVHAQCQYEVTAVVEGPNCGVLGPSSVHFMGINDIGQACGRRSVCNVSGPSQWLPIVWTPELGLFVLSLPEGATQGVVNDINNVLGSDGLGQMACTLIGSFGGERAFLYDDGQWTMLPPENGSHSGAFAINDAGQLAGYRDISGTRFAFIWQRGLFTQIASPIGGQAIAFAINETGTATGLFGASTANGAGFMWDGPSITLIPPIANGTNSEGHGINGKSIVTGYSRIPVKSGSVPRRAWGFDSGKLMDLGGFADTHSNLSEDINDANQIIGTCYTVFNGGTPYLWHDNMLYDLRGLVDTSSVAVNFSAVKAINNRGQIVGYTGGSAEGIILTPINRPLGDVNIDCAVDALDIADVLRDWGPCPARGSCLCDIVDSATFQPPGDGVVDGADLAVVLGSWTVR